LIEPGELSFVLRSSLLLLFLNHPFSLFLSVHKSQYIFILIKMSTPYDLPSDPSKIKEFKWDDKYDFPRDLIGYGENSFNPQWPGGAKIAVSFVINYEEACLSPSRIASNQS